MKLVANWRRVLRHAWSIRLNLLASALGAAEVGVSIFVDDPPIARGSFALLAMGVSAAAGVARIVAQAPLSGDDA